MLEDFRADIARFHRSSTLITPTGLVRLLFRSYGLQAIGVYRLGRWLHYGGSNLGAALLALLLTPLYWLLTAYVRLAYDIRLEQSADIGPGLYIGHFGGIRVRGCSLGRNCAIQQEVHLEPPDGETEGPMIGECVWIGAHSRIQCPVHVGDRATVAAGSVVRRDVPAHSLALGRPAQIVQRNFDNSTFL